MECLTLITMLCVNPHSCSLFLFVGRAIYEYSSHLLCFCIHSHADNTWQVMYGYDPTSELTETQATKVIGGEVAMWGEHVDENNLMSIVYPRASAVGERLWSDASVTDTDDALERLLVQRCRLVARGIRSSAIQPGFCTSTYV